MNPYCTNHTETWDTTCEHCDYAREMGHPDLFPDMLFCAFHQRFIDINGGFYEKRVEVGGAAKP